MMKRKSIILATAFTIFTLGASFMGSMAWFMNTVTLSNIDMNGDSKGAYFAYGNGTSESPFGISTPRHLYNLAWLQYNGDFNKDVKNNSTGDEGADKILDKQYYFEIDPSLTDSLNMTGWTLPPIGTETYPFLGSFNGNNKTITNLTISNPSSFSQQPISSFSQKPISINYNDQTHERPEIVGFFGVIGKIDNTPSYSYTTSANAVTNVNLESITVKSETSQTLIGLAGGYVNGELSGVKVSGTSTIDVNGQASSAKSSITDNLSDYGLVGFTTKKESNGSYKQKLSEYYNNGIGSGEGPGNLWGGSINFQEFNDRLFYHLNNNITIPDLSNGQSGSSLKYRNYIRYKSLADDSKLSFYYNSGSETEAQKNKANNTFYAQDPNNNEVIYNLVGKYDGDWTTATSSSAKATKPINVPGTVQPLLINADYSTSSSNTGYLVSGNSLNTGPNNQNSMTPYIVSASKPIRYINNSTNDAAISDYNVQRNPGLGTYVDYDKTKLEILTPKKNSTYSTNNYVLIKDEMEGYNSAHTPLNDNIKNMTKDATTTPTSLGLTEYNDSRVKLHKFLATDNGDGTYTSKTHIHGIHFRGHENDKASTYINKNNKITVNTVTINEETITDDNGYELPTSCIDFNLKEEGKINLFAGSYFYMNTDGVNTTNSFISLWKITRNANNTLSSISQIKAIYKNNNESAAETYSYKYDGGSTPSQATLVFDLDFLNKNMPVKNAIYYFEFPVNAGEYAIGVADNSAGGAYLMYLDIGTSGEAESGDNIKAYSITTIKDENAYPAGVDFVPIQVSGNGGDTIATSITSGEKGVLTFIVSNNDITVTDLSSISEYSYRSNKWVEANPTPTQYTCNLPGAPPSESGGGTRVLTIMLTTSNEVKHTIEITDKLVDNSGSYSENESVYKIDGVKSTKVQVEALSTFIDLTNVRALVKVVELTRKTGTKDFVTTYDTINCSYKDKKIDVDIATNGTAITVGEITVVTVEGAQVAYKFYVSGVQKYEDEIIS